MIETALVRWAGTQSDVLAGDLSGHVDLGALSAFEHLYAVGPLEGLRGEVSIFDGQPLISRVVDGALRNEASFNAKACFLVYAQIPAWREIKISRSIADDAELKTAIVEIALHMAVDVSRPVPFMLRATPESALIHVLDKRDGLRHNAALHEKAKVRFPIVGQSIEIVGFYSPAHRGVFTPHDSYFHMHLRTLDNVLSGHLEKLRTLNGAKLYLPA